MELQALLVLCGVGVAGVAVVLLMGLFSASGTSYEEAIAQQRKAATELLALAESKNKPKKNTKKANKKLAKKEKNKEVAAATGSEPESEAPAESGVEDDPAPATKPHVEFSPPVVVDIARDTPPNVKIRKRGKDPKIKPILLNKEDPSCVSDAAQTPGGTPVSNHFEEMHPKDEFELMHSHADKAQEKKEEVVEKKEQKPAKAAKRAAAKAPEPIKEDTRERHNSGDAPKEQRKAKKMEKKPSEDSVDAPREEPVMPLNAPHPSELTTEKLMKHVAAVATAPAPSTKGKKKKPEPNVLSLMAAGDGGGVNVGELVRLVREAALSRTEIQILTDALLNKHHDPLPEHSEWTEGPNDPMQKLKKQLADKEKALADEIEASQALHAKLKELRANLNAERGRAAATARSAEQAAAAARAELHTQQARIQRLLEDNQQLQQEKLMVSALGGSWLGTGGRRLVNLNTERGRAAATARSAEQAAAAARAELHTQQARIQRLLEDNHQEKLMVSARGDSWLGTGGRRLVNLNTERGRAAATARSAQAAAAARAELHTQQARIQRLLEDNQQLQQEKLMVSARGDSWLGTGGRRLVNLNTERGRAAATARSAEQAAAAARAELHNQQARIQRLLEDNQQLQQEKLMLQSKLAAEGETQAQRVQMEMHIQRLSEAEAALIQQLNALQAELNARVIEVGQARCEANAAREASMLAQQHVGELAQQLQEANRAFAEIDQQRQCAAHGEQVAQQELRQLQDRLASMSDLQNEVQRLTSRAQAAESAVEKVKEESEKQKQQLSSELASLKELLAARETELAELKQMRAAPAQNGLPPANDHHKAAELAKVESVVEGLRSELAAAQRSSAEQRDQLARLQDQLQGYQAKNNELRTKNWKVMEALQSAEKALQAATRPAQDSQSVREAIAKAEESQYSEMARILRSACPSAAPSTSPSVTWLAAFADNLRAELSKSAVPDSQPANDRLAELAAQNEHLQALVDKYKKIIDDTEGVLSRLQQNVTAEEQRWEQQLADKQRELDELRARTLTQMQKKIDSLQAELQQAKSNHSFADAERLTEERLMMAGLSDKHSIDVCNGPTQVELQEK